MKIVIDIPEELYKQVKAKYIPLPHDFADVMDNAINNGTPYEEGSLGLISLGSHKNNSV